tara:strand:- start:208 stop:582 length:375 start_codon:yes stop_codon:yes gene_type:complete
LDSFSTLFDILTSTPNGIATTYQQKCGHDEYGKRNSTFHSGFLKGMGVRQTLIELSGHFLKQSLFIAKWEGSLAKIIAVAPFRHHFNVFQLDRCVLITCAYVACASSTHQKCGEISLFGDVFYF